ncbi:hypothetical protein [Ktedonospora formicarum]|uniref:hypothetical protein n=1 Tax=Ktedonospora formicarum TaxID=2778364 RepID=UPI001C68A133|nr:hypothetical protein [Ktedonospora formicarum]
MPIAMPFAALFRAITLASLLLITTTGRPRIIPSKEFLRRRVEVVTSINTKIRRFIAPLATTPTRVSHATCTCLSIPDTHPFHNK